jgi:ribonucleoside-diphosphate reductase alpha chain
MATSILDYIFRELAISYLDRGDLAHVQPSDLLPDAVGKGEAESTLGGPDDGDRPEVAAMMRHGASSGYVRSKLTVVHGGAGRAPAAAFDGALAVSAPPEEDYANELRLERIGNFTLIRNGTCLKCDTCGATSGCS